jgi:putative tricarboxylic transport membrane protein
VICAAAADDIKWRETVIWAAVLTAFCAFLFPYGLNLPFQLWPRWW